MVSSVCQALSHSHNLFCIQFDANDSVSSKPLCNMHSEQDEPLVCENWSTKMERYLTSEQ